MSAICGLLALDDFSPLLRLLDRMLQALEKHGPDGSGSWKDGSAALGHQMLHVTPESLHEQLPRSDPESKIAITFDGRIDNREDLLELLGLPQNADVPDSTLTVLAYKKWGIDCAERLVGEFAFALWDAREQTLHCVTDPMGIRPLFYTETAGRHFAFASEVVALLNLGDGRVPISDRRLAMLGISAYTRRLEPAMTCFENIFRVPAASVLSVGKSGKRISNYWKPDHRGRLNFKTDEECWEAYQEVFGKAVKARLRSAFPVASLLSGGLDSSGIVSIASELLARENKKLITLSTVAMPSARDHVIDERKYIDLFRFNANLKMRYVSAANRGPFDNLEELVQSASLCSYSFQHFQYSAFARVAQKDHARVILDGHAGEFSLTCRPLGYMAELFAGCHWKRLLSELRHLDSGHSFRLQALKKQVLRPLLPYRLLKFLNRHLRYGSLVAYPVRPEFVRDVLGNEVEGIKDELYQALADLPDHRKNMVRIIKSEQDNLMQRSHAGFIGYQDAGFSFPYLDKRVLEFSLAVDGRFKHRNGKGRQLFRIGMSGLLPPEILKRTSKGLFSPDYHLRYERQKKKAESTLKAFAEDGKWSRLVDYNRVMPALNSVPAYDSEAPVWFDYESQFLVPNAVYMCYFLNEFSTFQ